MYCYKNQLCAVIEYEPNYDAVYKIFDDFQYSFLYCFDGYTEWERCIPDSADFAEYFKKALQLYILLNSKTATRFAEEFSKILP